ncbi:hypothetical protein [uncultured Veillonella sp.]|uniref:hypothetical protein n=1 Tax=uncultured Veillonella sp. TaxID=159268 RepID=UPI0028DC7F39|nr:hypothetical protein [uncultured Veillonella sp.]
MVKKFVLMAVACACVGSYTVAGAQGTLDVKPDPAKPVVAEQVAPVVGMPNPIHEFATIDEAAKYMNITPQLPKVLPVGYNIESVSTIEKDVLQVVYVYQVGEDATRNQAAGKRIIHRIANIKGDISGDHKDYRVTATEKVNGTKVTFKGGNKMVYLAGWTKDGQTHGMYFERPVTRDMAKAIIANIVAPKLHTK